MKSVCWGIVACASFLFQHARSATPGLWAQKAQVIRANPNVPKHLRIIEFLKAARGIEFSNIVPFCLFIDTDDHITDPLFFHICLQNALDEKGILTPPYKAVALGRAPKLGELLQQIPQLAQIFQQYFGAFSPASHEEGFMDFKTMAVPDDKLDQMRDALRGFFHYTNDPISSAERHTFFLYWAWCAFWKAGGKHLLQRIGASLGHPEHYITNICNHLDTLLKDRPIQLFIDYSAPSALEWMTFEALIASPKDFLAELEKAQQAFRTMQHALPQIHTAALLLLHAPDYTAKAGTLFNAFKTLESTPRDQLKLPLLSPLLKQYMSTITKEDIPCDLATLASQMAQANILGDLWVPMLSITHLRRIPAVQTLLQWYFKEFYPRDYTNLQNIPITNQEEAHAMGATIIDFFMKQNMPPDHPANTNFFLHYCALVVFWHSGGEQLTRECISQHSKERAKDFAAIEGLTSRLDLQSALNTISHINSALTKQRTAHERSQWPNGMLRLSSNMLKIAHSLFTIFKKQHLTIPNPFPHTQRPSKRPRTEYGPTTAPKRPRTEYSSTTEPNTRAKTIDIIHALPTDLSPKKMLARCFDRHEGQVLASVMTNIDKIWNDDLTMYTPYAQLMVNRSIADLKNLPTVQEALRYYFGQRLPEDHHMFVSHIPSLGHMLSTSNHEQILQTLESFFDTRWISHLEFDGFLFQNWTRMYFWRTKEGQDLMVETMGKLLGKGGAHIQALNSALGTFRQSFETTLDFLELINTILARLHQLHLFKQDTSYCQNLAQDIDKAVQLIKNIQSAGLKIAQFLVSLLPSLPHQPQGDTMKQKVAKAPSIVQNFMRESEAYRHNEKKPVPPYTEEQKRAVLSQMDAYKLVEPEIDTRTHHKMSVSEALSRIVYMFHANTEPSLLWELCLASIYPRKKVADLQSLTSDESWWSIASVDPDEVLLYWQQYYTLFNPPQVVQEAFGNIHAKPTEVGAISLQEFFKLRSWNSRHILSTHWCQFIALIVFWQSGGNAWLAHIAKAYNIPSQYQENLASLMNGINTNAAIRFTQAVTNALLLSSQDSNQAVVGAYMEVWRCMQEMQRKMDEIERAAQLFFDNRQNSYTGKAPKSPKSRPAPYDTTSRPNRAGSPSRDQL